MSVGKRLAKLSPERQMFPIATKRVASQIAGVYQPKVSQDGLFAIQTRRDTHTETHSN